LFERLDPTLYTIKKIEEVTRLPVLGQIALAKRQDPRAFLASSAAEQEAFHRLRVAILARARDLSLKTLLVTSAEPKVGTSTIVSNLARAIAQTGRRVVVVDADMRRPTLHTIFGVSNEVGLGSALGQAVGLDEAVQSSTIPEVYILPSGSLPANPAELLGSSQMQDVLRQLAQQYDLVLIDTPALGAAADAEELALAVDGVILVVRRAHSQEETVRKACRQLATLKAKLIGVIVNRADQVPTTISHRSDINSAIKGYRQRRVVRSSGGRIYDAVIEPTAARGSLSVPAQANGEAPELVLPQQPASPPAQASDEVMVATLPQEPISLPAQMEGETTLKRISSKPSH
jgi:capsular exopolysaccharide synthesis family protein